MIDTNEAIIMVDRWQEELYSLKASLLEMRVDADRLELAMIATEAITLAVKASEFNNLIIAHMIDYEE